MGGSTTTKLNTMGITLKDGRQEEKSLVYYFVLVLVFQLSLLIFCFFVYDSFYAIMLVLFISVHFLTPISIYPQLPIANFKKQTNLFPISQIPQTQT